LLRGREHASTFSWCDVTFDHQDNQPIHHAVRLFDLLGLGLLLIPSVTPAVGLLLDDHANRTVIIPPRDL
jgi:hypothetical protein